MKHLVIILFVSILVSCSQEDPKPLQRMSANNATIDIKSYTQYVLKVVHMDKSGWKEGDVILADTVISGDFTANINVTKDQNFCYFIQKRDKKDKTTISATLNFKGETKTKSFTGEGLLWDIYEFYPQIYAQ